MAPPLMVSVAPKKGATWGAEREPRSGLRYGKSEPRIKTSERRKSVLGGIGCGDFSRFGCTSGAIGFSFDLDDDGAVDEAVEESHRQWSIGEIASPAVEVDVRDQGGGTALMTFDDHLIE